MNILYNSIFLEHDTGMHPENKKRLLSCGDLPESKIENGEKYLSLVHDQKYIKEIKDICAVGGHLDPDTIVSKKKL